VTTGLENEEWIEIVESPETEMVRPGEVVLTGGHFTLTHDANASGLWRTTAGRTGRPQ
jgi:hypothetical protein